jgi:hypothetical protein
MITVSHGWSTSLLTHLPLSITINLSHCCCHHCSCTYNPPQWPASTTTTSVSSHNLPWTPNGKMCGCKFAASCTYLDVDNHQLVLRGPGPLKIPGPSQHTLLAITKCCSKCASTCAMSMRLHQGLEAHWWTMSLPAGDLPAGFLKTNSWCKDYADSKIPITWNNQASLTPPNIGCSSCTNTCTSGRPHLVPCWTTIRSPFSMPGDNSWHISKFPLG